MLVGRHNIRYNGTRHNEHNSPTQHNDIHHNEHNSYTQHNDIHHNEHNSHTQHKDIQNNVVLGDALFIMSSVIIL